MECDQAGAVQNKTHTHAIEINSNSGLYTVFPPSLVYGIGNLFSKRNQGIRFTVLSAGYPSDSMQIQLKICALGFYEGKVKNLSNNSEGGKMILSPFLSYFDELYGSTDSSRLFLAHLA